MPSAPLPAELVRVEVDVEALRRRQARGREDAAFLARPRVREA